MPIVVYDARPLSTMLRSVSMSANERRDMSRVRGGSVAECWLGARSSTSASGPLARMIQ